MKALTIKLPPPLEARLEAAGRARHLSRSALVRDALERYLDSSAAPADGFASRAGGLQASIRAARDLSTNPAHLKGFGR